MNFIAMLLSDIWVYFLRCTIGLMALFFMLLLSVFLIIESIILKFCAQSLWLCKLNSSARCCDKMANGVLDGFEYGYNF